MWPMGGRSRRQLMSLIFLTLAGFTVYMFMMILSPSSNLLSRHTVPGNRIHSPAILKEVSHEEHLESYAIQALFHGPAAMEDIPQIPRGEKVAQNEFYYQPGLNEQVPPSLVQTTNSILELEAITLDNKLFAANATELQPAQPIETEDSDIIEIDKNSNDKRKGQSPNSASDEEKKKPSYATPKSDQPQQKTVLVQQPMPPKIPAFTPRRYIKDQEGFHRYRKYLEAKESPVPEQQNAVIILTNHRSGSSFFGELFNQHPDAFYMFEPLFPLSNSSNCELHKDLKVETLKDLVHCKLPNWQEVNKRIPLKEQISSRNHNMKNCILKGMCFRSNTKEMCEDKHCPRNLSSSVKTCSVDCGMINTYLTDNDCRRKKMVALKIIRLCDILDIESIIKNLTSVKILHLLRDPRGIANSRKSLSSRVNLKESLYKTCKRQSHNLLTGIKNTPDWLTGKYMVVRYEDTALYPYETAQSVYDFVGLSFPDEMKNWIAKNTDIEMPTGISLGDGDPQLSAKTVGDATNEKEKQPKLIPRVKRLDPYGTKRNSTAIVQKWTKSLPYSVVLQIENVCANIMEMAGYLKVGTLEQYQDKNKKFFAEKITILNDSVST